MLSNEIHSQSEESLIFHDLSKHVRRQKIILEMIKEAFKDKNLQSLSDEINDFDDSQKYIKTNFDRLKAIITQSNKDMNAQDFMQ